MKPKENPPPIESPPLTLNHHVFMPFSILNATASPKLAQPDTELDLAPTISGLKRGSPDQSPFVQSTKASGPHQLN